MSKEAQLGGVTAEPDADVREDYRIGLPAIFAAFFWRGVTSFGGNTAAWLYHQIVQRRCWVTDAEFLSDVALGWIVPGSGRVNLTVQVGHRLRGGAAAAAAAVGSSNQKVAPDCSQCRTISSPVANQTPACERI